MATKQVDIVIKGRDESSAASAAVARLEGRFKSLASVAVGAFAGFGAGAFIKSSIDAFIDADKQSQKLASALRMIGAGSEEAMTSMRRFATEVMNQTTLDDDAVMGLASLGASLGHLSGDALKRATVAAIGLSRSLNIDVDTAMRLVSKAANGNFTTFQRYGLKLDETANATTKFNQVLDIGGKAFQLARDETGTLSGKLEKLKVNFGNLEESIGGAMAPTLMGLSDDINVYVTKTLPAFGAELGRLSHQFVGLGNDAKDAGDKINYALSHPAGTVDTLFMKTMRGTMSAFETMAGDEGAFSGPLFQMMTGLNREGVNARIAEIKNQVRREDFVGPLPGGTAPVGTRRGVLGDYLHELFGGDKTQIANEARRAAKDSGFGFGTMLDAVMRGMLAQRTPFQRTLDTLAEPFQNAWFGLQKAAGPLFSGKAKDVTQFSAAPAVTSPFVNFDYASRNNNRDIVKPMVEEQKETNLNLKDLIRAVEQNRIGVEPIV